MAKVALIGLGVMGYPMAGHILRKGGHELTVYNRTAAKAEKWVAEHGGRRADDAARGGARAPSSSSPASATTTTCARSRSATTARSPACSRARSSSTTRPPRADGRARARTRPARKRGVGFLDAPVSGGQAGARERRAHGDGRRRRRRLRAGRKPVIDCYARMVGLMGPAGRRAAHQDGQPDLHRRAASRASPKASTSPRRPGSTCEQVIGDDLQGRGAVLADGEPLEDDDRGQVRLRLRRRLDAQGPGDRARRGAPQWREACR